jgi:hypothetical protein
LSITQSLWRLMTVTGRTAVRDAQEVGGQFLTLARHVAGGTRSASAAIAGDVVDVARRASAGMGQGFNELTDDIATLRRLARKPGARIVARRPTAVQRLRQESSRRTAKAAP